MNWDMSLLPLLLLLPVNEGLVAVVSLLAWLAIDAIGHSMQRKLVPLFIVAYAVLLVTAFAALLGGLAGSLHIALGVRLF